MPFRRLPDLRCWLGGVTGSCDRVAGRLLRGVAWPLPPACCLPLLLRFVGLGLGTDLGLLLSANSGRLRLGGGLFFTGESNPCPRKIAAAAGGSDTTRVLRGLQNTSVQCKSSRSSSCWYLAQPTECFQYLQSGISGKCSDNISSLFREAHNADSPPACSHLI